MVTAINNGHGEHSPIEQRMIDHIQQYGPTMTHIAGKDNNWADLLSRPNEPRTPRPNLTEHVLVMTQETPPNNQTHSDTDSNSTPRDYLLDRGDSPARNYLSDDRSLSTGSDSSAESECDIFTYLHLHPETAAELRPHTRVTPGRHTSTKIDLSRDNDFRQFTTQDFRVADPLPKGLVRELRGTQELFSPQRTLPRTAPKFTGHISTTDHDPPPPETLPLTLTHIAIEQGKERILETATGESKEVSSQKLSVELQRISDDITQATHVLGVREVTSNSFRPVIPETLRAAVFRVCHNTLHPSADRTIELIEQHYWWPNMRKDITLWAKTCPNCQRSKVTRHNRGQLSQFPPNNQRFGTYHADLVGPLEASQGYKYFITLRERATGFLMTHPLRDKSTWTVINAIKHRLIAVFGTPTVIITDNGGEFVSHAFTQFCSSLGITHKLTTPYHPQANGAAERVHRIIKSALRAQTDPSEWADHLPFITLTLNNLTCDNNFFTPFQQTFGQPGRLPGTLILGDKETTLNTGVSHVYSFLSHLNDMYRTARPLPTIKAYTEPTLFTCDKVWVRQDAYKQPLAPLYHGPYKVVERHTKYFTLLTHRGLSPVSIDRLKTAFELPSPEAADLIRNEESETNSESDDNPDIAQGPYSLRKKQKIDYHALNTGD